MSRKYRIRHIHQKPKNNYTNPINKSVQQMVSNPIFQKQIKQFCCEYGRTYMTVVGLIMALGEGCRKGYGTTRLSQANAAEKIGIHKDTANDYLKDMEQVHMKE